VLGLALIGGAVAFLSRVGVTTRGTDLIVPLAMTGAGMGLMLMTLTTHLLNAAPPKLVSRVTSLTGALQQVVTSLSIASLATLLTARAATHLDATKAALAGQPAGASRLAHELGAAATTALTSAFDDTFRVMIVVAVAGALLGLTLRRPWATSMEAADDLTAAEIEEVPAMDSALAS